MTHCYDVKIHLSDEQEEVIRKKYKDFKKVMKNTSWLDYLQIIAEMAVVIETRT